jgi:ABC-type multidrug transport system permease subunit
MPRHKNLELMFTTQYCIILLTGRITNTEDINIGLRYLLSLYYVTTVITFHGSGEITAQTATELTLTVLMIFITVFVVGFLVGEMTQCLAGQFAGKMHYRHRLRVMEVYESSGSNSL